MQRNKKVKTKPDQIDIFVGKKLKAYRLLNSLSQEKIAHAVGLTFQQIQKYESGKNRMTASRMYSLAKILNINVGAFFVGIEDKETCVDQKASRLVSFDKESIEMIKLFQSISNENTRKSLVRLLRTLPLEEI